MVNWFKRVVDRVKDTSQLHEYQKNAKGQEMHFPKLEDLIRNEYSELRQIVKEMELMSVVLKQDAQPQSFIQEVNIDLFNVREVATEHIALANEKKLLSVDFVTRCAQSGTFQQKLEAYKERTDHNADVMQTLVRARLAILDMKERLEPRYKELKQQYDSQKMQRSREIDRQSTQSEKHEIEMDTRFDMYSKERLSNIHDRILSHDAHMANKEKDLEESHAYGYTR